MTDAQLYELCKKYGAAALEARRKFAGLLPEVFRRHLYEKKGFSSIYEFAAKLAGMSYEQTTLVLRLEKRFENMPHLHSALVKGEVSVNKLVKIASIATPENEEELSMQTQTLSTRALETLARDESENFDNRNGLLKGKNEGKSVHVNSKTTQFSKPVHGDKNIILDEDVEKELLDLQQKGININELLREFLEKRKLELAQEKEQLAQEQADKGRAAVLGKDGVKRETVTRGETGSGQMMKKPSRYIPAKIRNHLKQEYGTKCAIPACHKTAQYIHHTARFSLSQNHDPNYLAPLCKGHHELAHSIDMKVREQRMVQRL